MPIGSTSLGELPVTNSVGIINNIQEHPNQQMPNQQMPNQQMPNQNMEMPRNMESTRDLQDNSMKNTVISESRQTYNELVGQIQQADKTGATQLPSRDIPQNPNAVTMDETVKPNYISEQERLEDYIQNYETPDELIEKNQRDEKNQDSLENFYQELQMPILIAILYFLFNLPIIRKYLYKFLPKMFEKDGNPNLYGYVFNSLTFAFLYYLLTKILGRVLEI